jgi:FAD/FMN-containing dehydrogenase
VVNLKEELIKISGADGVLDDPGDISSYIQGDNLEPRQMPNYVVKVKSADEAQKVVQLANEKKLPVVPSSSGSQSRIMPNQGGILLDLSQMKEFQTIDTRNRKVRIEPGVTWAELGAEAAKHGMMTYSPLLPHADRSVITTLLEREPLLNSKFEYGEQILALEMIWPTGDLFKTGTASYVKFPEGLGSGDYPYGPGPIDPLRLLQGAQGTMGVVTWANLKIEPIPKATKTFFMPFDSVEDMNDAIFAIQRKRIGFECFAMNSLNLASILAKDMSEDFTRLQKALPSWSLLLIINGPEYFPEEKIAYEVEALNETRQTVFPQSKVLDVIPGYGSTDPIPQIFRNPWPKDQTPWKSRYKGASRDLFFLTILDKAPEFISEIKKVAANHGFKSDDIGIYIQPIDYGAAAHVEFNFFYNQDDADEAAKVKKVYIDSIDAALKLEAHFSRPYGKEVATPVYEKAASYTQMLKKTKAALDPNNVMNPGALCF